MAVNPVSRFPMEMLVRDRAGFVRIIRERFPGALKKPSQASERLGVETIQTFRPDSAAGARNLLVQIRPDAEISISARNIKFSIKPGSRVGWEIVNSQSPMEQYKGLRDGDSVVIGRGSPDSTRFFQSMGPDFPEAAFVVTYDKAAQTFLIENLDPDGMLTVSHQFKGGYPAIKPQERSEIIGENREKLREAVSKGLLREELSSGQPPPALAHLDLSLIKVAAASDRTVRFAASAFGELGETIDPRETPQGERIVVDVTRQGNSLRVVRVEDPNVLFPSGVVPSHVRQILDETIAGFTI